MTGTKYKYVIVDAYGEKLYTAYVSDPAQGLRGAVLESFHAPHSNLQCTDFSDCTMSWASLAGADLSFCLFRNTDLRGSTLDSAVLRFADLTGADLGPLAAGLPASLLGADLTGANLHGAKLAGVTYDEKTLFPEGFSPDAAGMAKT